MHIDLFITILNAQKVKIFKYLVCCCCSWNAHLFFLLYFLQTLFPYFFMLFSNFLFKKKKNICAHMNCCIHISITFYMYYVLCCSCICSDENAIFKVHSIFYVLLYPCVKKLGQIYSVLSLLFTTTLAILNI